MREINFFIYYLRKSQNEEIFLIEGISKILFGMYVCLEVRPSVLSIRFPNELEALNVLV